MKRKSCGSQPSKVLRCPVPPFILLTLLLHHALMLDSVPYQHTNDVQDKNGRKSKRYKDVPLVIKNDTFNRLPWKEATPAFENFTSQTNLESGTTMLDTSGGSRSASSMSNLKYSGFYGLEILPGDLLFWRIL